MLEIFAKDKKTDSVRKLIDSLSFEFQLEFVSTRYSYIDDSVSGMRNVAPTSK